MKRRVAGLLVLCSQLLVACSSPSGPGPEDPVRAQAPSIETIVAAHDARVGAIDTFWARASVRVEGQDAEGSKFSEQGEGTLQAELPENVAVILGKLGQDYFALGANSERYWLVDVSDSDRRVMVSGAQALATPRKAAALGLPVYPRDIPLLLGLIPLEGRTVGEPTINGQGEVVVAVDARWGLAELRFEPRFLDLVGAAAFDADGTLLADAELSRHIVVANQVGQGRLGRVPGTAEIRVPGFDGFVRMVLEDARVRTNNATVFNPDRLRRAYRVREFIDLDEPPADEIE